MENDAVITGVSVISPFGNKISTFQSAMFAAKSAVIDIRGKVVDKNFPVPYGAILQDEIPIASYLSVSEINFQNLGIASRSAAFLCEEMKKNFILDNPIDGVIWGSAEGVDFPLARKSFQTNCVDSFPWKSTLSQDPLETILLGLKQSIPKKNIACIDNACVTGTLSIGHAAQRIRSGEWKRALVGAARFCCTEDYLMRFYLLGVLATEAGDATKVHRPFAKNRCGFVVGEGAGMILMESRSAAEQRGAKILGTISGFANTTDAWHLTSGRQDIRGCAKAMQLAIQDAGLEIDSIDYINAHGTGTKLNDFLETKAIKAVFGKRAYEIPVSSLKSQIGHTLHACGILECIAATMMLGEQKIAPTINYSSSDPDCDLDYVPNKSRGSKLNHILSNNMAFGGQNACLIISRGEA